MAYDPTLYVDKTSPTTAICACPCGQQFQVDAIEERNLVFDTERRLLRAVCPRCGRLEDPSPFWVGAKFDAVDPPANRIKQYLD